MGGGNVRNISVKFRVGRAIMEEDKRGEVDHDRLRFNSGLFVLRAAGQL